MTTKIGGGFWVQSDAQAKVTLSLMRRYVNEAIANHDFVWWTRDEINKISSEAIMNRNWTGVARAIRDYTAAHIRFVPDPEGVENITYPMDHMKFLRSHRVLLGDCDDAATLSAAMGKAVGIPAEFRILAFYKPDNPYQHVITYLHPRGGSVIDMDTTRFAQSLPPIATRSFSIRV